MAKAAAAVRRGAWRAALGELLGLLFFTRCDDAWQDNEVGGDGSDAMPQLFDTLSAAWRALLVRTDDELGLAVPAAARAAGVASGANRARLHALLAEWQDNTNDVLADYEDDGFPGGAAPRVAIF